MQETATKKFLFHTMDFFRTCGFQNLDLALISLQILAWIKLSQDRQLSDDIALNDTNKPCTIEELNSVFTRLAEVKTIGYKKDAFDAIFIQSKDINISELINKAIQFKQDCIVKEFEIYEFFRQSLNQRTLGGLIPTEISELMTALVGELAGKSVYCPWDSFSNFASLACREGAKSSIESSIHTIIPGLVNIFKDMDAEICYGDPIMHPAYKSQGQLQQFDLTISLPPLGTKYDKQVNEEDWFNRFPEKTISGDVLHIRHIISQTREKAVIAVANRFLFSLGGEQSLRADLLKNNQIEAVISLPAGLLPGTGAYLSIIVINIQGKSSHVNFVNGNDERFFSKDRKSGARLENWQLLLDTLRAGKDESCVVRVPVEQIIANNCYLEVNQYTQPPERKNIYDFLRKSQTKSLDAVVKIIRLPFKQRIVENIAIENVTEAIEITMSDFPEYGYVRNPSRIIKLEKENKTEYFLEPGDILISVKASSGKVAIVSDMVKDKENRPWIANQSCLVLRCLENKIDPKILFMYLTSNIGQYLLRSISSGASIPIIQLARLKELEIIIPTHEEQHKIMANFDRLVELQSQMDSIRQEQEQLNNSYWSL
jgi:type I restriction enzyme M protein